VVFKDPSRFSGQEIPLASDALTMDEIAAILLEVTGKTVIARFLSKDEAIAGGIDADIARTQVWWDVEGYRVDLEKARAYGIVLDSFRDFTRRHAGDFVIRGYGSDAAHAVPAVIWSISTNECALVY
jgi:uncharacterized protein YbjT (DUF2867 family)